MDIFNDGDFYSVYVWIRQYPQEFLLSYLLMFGLINIFYILPRRVYLMISSIFLALFSILGFISRQKFIIKGTPLLPSDFFLVQEVIEISGRFKNVIISIAIISFSALTLILLLFKYIPKEKYKWPQKFAVVSISSMLLFIFYANFGNIQKAFSLEVINWSQKMSYDENGMLLGFILDAEYLKVPRPLDYQENTIQQILEEPKAAYPVDPDFKPNIIFVMSEAFWDPTLMKDVSFGQDPIPFFHSLQKSQTGGIMLSAVYGGGTANTELEALTGFSTQFLPGGVIPYAHYINRPIEALPTILQRQGYATSAIHTYDNWYYNRNNVYKYFGFDKFISKEFLNNPEYKGQYIRDTELTKKILAGVKETNKPDFIFAVSMQSHGPYSSVKNPENTIKVSDSTLSPSSQAILENYANTVSDADQSLEQLIQGLKQIKEPTIVIFFGDHLPLLGDNYSVYKEAGFIKADNSYQDYLQLHSVPFVTWNNFSSAKQSLRLSSNFMGTLALELAKKSGSPMTDFLSNLMQHGSNVVINPDYSSQEKITPTEKNKYELLQYDLLFGQEYTYQVEPGHKPPKNNTYIQGNGQLEITKVESPGGFLKIQGKNFVENDRVYINGKLVKSAFLDSNNLTVNLPEDLRNKNGALNIQIKLIDSQKNMISQSNLYLLEN